MMPIMQASLELPRSRELSRKTKSELFRYFPIAVVGALEGYFRMLYADLINSGDPYARRAHAFRNVRRDPPAVSHAHPRKITRGEFIAHQLRHNSFRDISDNMSILLGTKFDSLLASDSVAPFATFAWGRNYLQHLAAELNELFRLRHLLCHELATKVKLTAKRARQLCQTGVFLAMLTDMLMMDFVDKDKPLPVIRA
jgi:hypothetical protein